MSHYRDSIPPSMQPPIHVHALPAPPIHIAPQSFQMDSIVSPGVPGRQPLPWDAPIASQLQAAPHNVSSSHRLTSFPIAAWQAVLHKSGAPVCSLTCIREGGSESNFSEPLGWPNILDVNLRADLRHAEAHFASTPPSNRAVRWLTPVKGDGDPARLPDFIKYLADKSRAGVIKQFGDGSRTLYIMPPSKAVCVAMGLRWPPPLPGPTILVAEVSSTGGLSFGGSNKG